MGIPSSSRSFEIAAYFPEWGPRDGFYVKNLVDTGSAGKITLINYAFGIPAIHSESQEVTCQIEAPYYAYQQLYSAEMSVDGAADDPEQPLRGHFNQLRKLKQAYPQIRVVVSLGGWLGSQYFSLAARTPEAREKFVASCLDIYLHGNLPSAAGAAAGVFDGIDIDWEYPVVQGAEETLRDPSDGENFVELLKEFRRQFALAGRPDFLLTIAGAAGQPVAQHMRLAESAQYLDLVAIMTYDFHGGWSQETNHHTNLYTSERDIVPEDRRSSTDRSVQVYRDVFGVPAEKILIGAAFYGRAWQGVNSANNGLYQPGQAVTQAESNYARLKDLPAEGYSRYWDDLAQAPWLYHPGEQVFWTYDDPQSARLKGEYARQHGLGGVMFWEISGDDADGTLVSSLQAGLYGAKTFGE